MRLSRSVVFAIIVAIFVGILAYTSFKPQQITCEVCVDFRGASRCAKASGPTREAASETAQTAACGPMARGMDDIIACGRVIPRSVSCEG
ncbi:MAG: hypothetical protein KF785_13980 [Gemmatimonadales bacterium]|nr:hypothetical protein [Gemmatimonadales bacterium]